MEESVCKPFFLRGESLADSISPQKELYGYATDHFGVRGRKGPSRASYIRSSRVVAWPPTRWARQARTQAFERSCKAAHFRDDEKTLGRAQEGHESSIAKVEGKGIKRAAPRGSFYFLAPLQFLFSSRRSWRRCANAQDLDRSKRRTYLKPVPHYYSNLFLRFPDMPASE